jgi:hypothetical protein
MTFAVAGGFIVGSLVAISLVTMAVANPGSKAHDWVSSLKKKKKREADKYIHKWAASILQPKKKC